MSDTRAKPKDKTEMTYKEQLEILRYFFTDCGIKFQTKDHPSLVSLVRLFGRKFPHLRQVYKQNFKSPEVGKLIEFLQEKHTFGQKPSREIFGSIDDLIGHHVGMSKSQAKKMMPIFRAFENHVGLRSIDRHHTPKKVLLRICSARPEIAAVVRPEGGKVSPVQLARLAMFIERSDFTAPIESSPKKAKPARQKKAKSFVPVTEKEKFYKSWEWRSLRMDALKKYGAACQCCGATRDDVAMDGNRVKICVDHIKPISKHWDMRLDPDNLQVLCDECNQGKGSWDTTDWRDRVATTPSLPN